MKKLLVLVFLLLAGCSHAPTKVLMKNCDSLGNHLYNCEEVPAKDLGGRKR